MIALLFATAAAAPLTITTISGDLAADEVWILELDEDGNVRRGPTLEDVIESSFAWDDTDWSASTAALAAFHRDLGESQTHTSADVGHILGTEDGARACTCPQGCSSGDCEFSVEVDYLFSAPTRAAMRARPAPQDKGQPRAMMRHSAALSCRRQAAMEDVRSRR